VSPASIAQISPLEEGDVDKSLPIRGPERRDRDRGRKRPLPFLRQRRVLGRAVAEGPFVSIVGVDAVDLVIWARGR